VVRGEEEDIRPCILCYWCDDSRSSGGSIRCSVNPATGREGEYVIRPAKEGKDVIIIGGGPAGMEAGRVAALRGHRVRIYEKDGKLGGQLRLASVPPHKERIGRLTDYFISQLKKMGIEIALEREVTAEWLKEAKPDAVIVATGSTELLPHFSGMVEVPIHSAKDVLSGKAETGERVTILGGGMVGCEVAEFLKGQGKKVSVVEVLPELASNMRPTPRKKMLERLAQESIVFLTQARLERIEGRGLLLVDKEGNGVRIQTDTLVYATGATADQRLFDSLKGVFLHLMQAGDCIQPRSLIEAIDEGMQAGLQV
jgi:2-enoate reductase